MKIIDIALRRPVTVLICTIALVYFGLMSYGNMGMQQRPDVDLPVVMVTTTMTGASAEVMDNDVTDVLEEQLNTISGIESLSSSSYQGTAVTTIEFSLGRDIDAAAADVRDKVNVAQADLPDEADTPIISKFDVGDSAMVIAVLNGAASYKDKVYFADKVAKVKLQSVNGVGTVDLAGLRDREIRLWIDPVRLRSRGLVVEDLSNAIKNKHVELPAGSLNIDRFKMDLRLQGEYVSVDQLKSLPVTNRDGVVIRLGDVADVEDGFEEEENQAYFNGSETIMISVKKQRGYNEVKLCSDVTERFGEISKLLPGDMSLQVIYDKSQFVKRSMSGVSSDVINAVALCSVLMLFFLQTFRATFVTVVTMPVCLIGSFILMKALGVTINTMSMMGISLAVGMVVDATTVVLENIHRHMTAGETPLQAASEGAKEVSFSVIGGALTTMAVFSPVTFMGGIIGKFMFDFGVTIVLTIGLSLVLSLTLTPYLCSRLLKITEPGRAARVCDGILTSLEGAYRRVLTAAVRRRAVTMAVAVGLFAGGAVLVSMVGTSFMANDDQGSFKISCELQSGTEVQETGRVLQNMTEIIRRHPAVDYTYVNVGSGSGDEPNKGTVYVTLFPQSDRAPLDSVMDDVRTQLSGFRDVTMNFSSFGSKDLQMVLSGGTTEQLLEISGKILADLKATGKVTDVETDVRLDKPQINVELDRGMTDEMDVDIRSLTTEIQAYFGGVKAGVFKEGGYRYDIRLMSRADQRSSVEDLHLVSVKNGAGDIVQVPGLLKVKQVLSPSVVKRYGRQTSLSIEANVTKDFSTGEAVALIQQIGAKYIPEGISLQPSGQTKTVQEDMGRLLTALIVAVSLVYMIMAIQFESFLHPFTVMFTLPLLTPGAFGLLYLTGCKLDMMSYMGLILLVGIVVNNGIILVDFINQNRERGMDKVEAVISAGPARLRAILITALSTLIGAIPAALKLSEGSESRQPMSVAIFGGLFTSTLLTLLVIPVVYLILDDLKDRLSALITRVFRKRA